MTVSEKVVNQIRDSKTIGKSIITFTNGLLCIILVIISGTSDVNSADDAVKLRNLSVGFGAAVSILNLLLVLIIDIMISLCTDNVKDEQTLKDLFTSDPKEHPDDSIIEGTQYMVSILNQMKIASNNLDNDTVNNKDDFKLQLKNMEDALNKFGTIA
jgi:hypothetical protein